MIASAPRRTGFNTLLPEVLKLEDLDFERPAILQAVEPPEIRGRGRDDVRLLVSTKSGHSHTHFTRLADYFHEGDVLVVNDSAVLPASLPAKGKLGAFTLNLSTKYAPNLWLAEPRYSPEMPGPLPLQAGDAFDLAGLEAKFVGPFPYIERLWFVRVEGGLEVAMQRAGNPIRYSYVKETYPLRAYQTLFAKRPGSAEMPSAARPFSEAVVQTLKAKGVEIASLTLHTGVSSLEVEADTLDAHKLYAEPFDVPAQTAKLLNEAKTEGRRIVAVGTTVVRALETVWNGERFTSQQGFTGRFIRPGQCACVLDGLITGLHDPKASHLAMLYALAGQKLIREGYREAVKHKYLWHEFGDSHLIFWA